MIWSDIDQVVVGWIRIESGLTDDPRCKLAWYLRGRIYGRPTVDCWPPDEVKFKHELKGFVGLRWGVAIRIHRTLDLGLDFVEKREPAGLGELFCAGPVAVGLCVAGRMVFSWRSAWGASAPALGQDELGVLFGYS